MTTERTISSHLRIGEFKRPMLVVAPRKRHGSLNKSTFEYNAKRALSDFLANAEMIADDAIRRGGLRVMPRG
jgi:hypothetical protein